MSATNSSHTRLRSLLAELDGMVGPIGLTLFLMDNYITQGNHGNVVVH